MSLLDFFYYALLVIFDHICWAGFLICSHMAVTMFQCAKYLKKCNHSTECFVDVVSLIKE